MDLGLKGKLLGDIHCARAVIPHMRKRGGGTIVNVTGTTQQAVPLHTPGSACNAAIRMFIADAVCFLVSERATYVNGAALVVDGSKSVVI
jgi:NAD(P)-dependent dehydrogenase (short-subunit alcohol dehydrogenase family)